MKLDLITNKKKQSGFIYGNTNQKENIKDINPNDEYYTPNYAIEPILKYLKPKLGINIPNKTLEVSGIYHDFKIEKIPQGYIDLRFNNKVLYKFNE